MRSAAAKNRLRGKLLPRQLSNASYDSTLAETISGLFKAKVSHRRRPWRSFGAAEYATLDRVGWFNNRCLGPIGNILPADAEANFCAA